MLSTASQEIGSGFQCKPGMTHTQKHFHVEKFDTLYQVSKTCHTLPHHIKFLTRRQIQKSNIFTRYDCFWKWKGFGSSCSIKDSAIMLPNTSSSQLEPMKKKYTVCIIFMGEHRLPFVSWYHWLTATADPTPSFK